MRQLARALLVGFACAGLGLPQCTGVSQFATFQHQEIGAVRLYRDARPPKAVLFTSHMQVNTDGAPDSYSPDNTGITHICNGISVGAGGAPCQWKPNCLADFQRAKAAGFNGDPKICFFAMATRNGKPVVQGPGDPKPGFYVSTTTLTNPGAPAGTPAAYLDSNTVPAFVLPSHWNAQAFQGVRLGDVVGVYRKSTDKFAFAVAGDLGPRSKLGEGSVALHRALGNDPFIVRHGVRRALRGIGGRDVTFLVFPNSRAALTTYTPEAINAAGEKLLAAFGGREKFKACTQLAP